MDGDRVGSKVLEGGHGSAGLAMHLASVMGNSGTLISVESRPEHAEVGALNMDRLEQIPAGVSRVAPGYGEFGGSRGKFGRYMHLTRRSNYRHS